MRSWADVSLELFGTVDHAFELAVANNSAITETPLEYNKEGEFIVIIPNDIKDLVNQEILDQYRQGLVEPATGVIEEDLSLLPPEKGICFMEVCGKGDNKFKVASCGA